MDWCHDPEEYHEVEGRQDALCEDLSHLERPLREVRLLVVPLLRPVEWKSGSEALMSAQENCSSG